MRSLARRRCLHCHEAFLPDYRNAYHQRFCSTPGCRHASKRASQRRWLRKPANRNYFREPDNLIRVQEWRRTHPGYWRSVRHRCERDLGQSPVKTRLLKGGSAPLRQVGTLQDFCRSKSTVFIELMSRLHGCALQEDIAHWAAQVVTEAQCILVRCQLKILSQGQLELPINYHESG